MVDTSERFFLVLDCGKLSPDELLLTTEPEQMKRIVSYRHARTVWNQVQDHVIGKGDFLSCRTMGSNGHFYVAVYGERVPTDTQLRVFHIMDRYRQQHINEGMTFVRLPLEHENHLLDARRDAAAGRSPGTYTAADVKTGVLHETHSVRHNVIDVDSPPIPIDPPFQSVPLYREKQPQEKRVKKTRPFLERYYLARRLWIERTLTDMERAGKSTREKWMMRNIEQGLQMAASAAKKYRFANSAQALVHALMETETGTTIKVLPQTGIFIEFATPLDLGVYSRVGGLFFVSPVQAYRAYERIVGNQPRTFSDLVEDVRGLFVLCVLEEDGDVLLNLIYDSDRHAWKVPEQRQCPDHACKQIMTVEEQVKNGAFTIWQLCPKCEKIVRYFSRWFPIALLAIAGEFAEEAEPALREITETIIRKEKRPGSGKYEEHTEEVRFRIVTFDASVKRKVETVPTADHEREVSPSWLDLAVEKGTVIYVKRGFGKSVRNLDPARNARWKYKREVPVRAYEKRIPMTVANLQRVITKVVASKYK